MSFSLKYLFVLTAVAGVFTAALIYRTPLWAFIAVNVSLVILLAATVGVRLGRLNKAFSVSFCVVGWLYLAVAFIPSDSFRFSTYLPSKKIAVVVSPFRPLALLLESTGDPADVVFSGDEGPLLIQNQVAYRADDDFQRFEDVMASLSALVLGGLAGVIAVLLIRPKREA